MSAKEFGGAAKQFGRVAKQFAMFAKQSGGSAKQSEDSGSNRLHFISERDLIELGGAEELSRQAPGREAAILYLARICLNLRVCCRSPQDRAVSVVDNAAQTVLRGQNGRRNLRGRLCVHRLN